MLKYLILATTSLMVICTVSMYMIQDVSVVEPKPLINNPFNPLLQPGSYSNFQNTHPNAIPMSELLARMEILAQ